MQDSKLISILKTLSKPELKEFEKFIASPYFHKRRDVVQLFELIKIHHPYYTHKNFSKENIYKKLYPKIEYKDHIVRNLLSALLKMLEEYLAVSNFLKNPIEVKKHLLNELLEKKVSGVSEIIIRDLEKLLSLKSNYPDNYYSEKYYLENLKIIFNLQIEKQHLVNKSLITNSELIVFNFLESASVNLINMHNNSENYNYDYSGNLLGDFLSVFDLKKFIEKVNDSKLKSEEKEIATIYSCMMITMIEQQDEKYYFRLNELLLKNLNYFSRIEKYNLLVALGTCTSMKSTIISREKYLPELFKIYKLRLENKLYNFSENQNMSIIFFYSILKIGLTLKHIEWAEQFVTANLEKLAEEHRANMKHFANAQIYLTRKKFNEGIEELSKVHFTNPAFKFEVRNLQLQLYYELDEYESAIYDLDSYNHFLHSSKSVSEYFKVSSEEFLEIYRKLLKLKMGGKKNLTRKLLTEINNSRLSQKDWLREKYAELQSI